MFSPTPLIKRLRFTSFLLKLVLLGLGGALFLWLGTSCQLRQEEVYIELPKPAPQWFAECYLESGRLPHLYLTPVESYFTLPDSAQLFAYFNTLTQQTQAVLSVYDGSATLLYRDTLRYQLPDTANPLGHFLGKETIGPSTSYRYELEINLPEQRMASTTQMLSPINLRTEDLRYLWNRDSTQATIRLIWDDPDPSTENFYRAIIDTGKPDSVSNFEYRDIQFTTGKPFLVDGGNELEVGDKVSLIVYHIDERYYDFIQTTETSANAAGNPFREPVLIRSMFEGGIGAFVALSPSYPMRVEVPEP